MSLIPLVELPLLFRTGAANGFVGGVIGGCTVSITATDASRLRLGLREGGTDLPGWGEIL